MSDTFLIVDTLCQTVVHNVTPRSRRRARACLVMVSCALAILVWEVGLRNIGGIFHDRFTQPDAVRGWSLRPGYAGWINAENIIWMQVNRDGMRDRDHPVVTPPGTLRVAVLGDSYIQGLNVDPDKMFTTFLETRLNQCMRSTGTRIDVLNFGVSGYGTAQEWLTYTHHAAKYRPDIVLLAVYTNNDIHNNHRRLNPTEVSDQSPYFTLAGEALVLDDRYRAVLAAMVHQPWWRRGRIWLTERLRVAQLAHDVWSGVRSAWIGEKGGNPDEGPDIGEDAIYRPPVVPELIEAWKVTEALILQLAEDVTRAGAEPWVVTLANGPQLLPGPDERQRFADQLGVGSLFYPDRRINTFAQQHGIGAIALAEPMSDYATRQRTHLRGGYTRAVPFGAGHLNEHGNWLAATLVADRLCADSVMLRKYRSLDR